MTAIETTLVGHPGVTEAAVIAEPMASGDHRLVAYAVPASAAPPAAGALRDFAAGRLPDYMVPSAFVTLEALPLTHTGKIDRRRLHDVRKVGPVLACALISPLETALAALWAEVLELDALGIHDPFVELGGNSLLAFAIAARIRTTWGVALSPQVLLEAPTVERMAQAVLEALADAANADTVAALLSRVEQPEKS